MNPKLFFVNNFFHIITKSKNKFAKNIISSCDKNHISAITGLASIGGNNVSFYELSYHIERDHSQTK